MKCENAQFNLALYAEEILTDEEVETANAHLVNCPVCRAKLAEFQSVRNDLRRLPPPEMPPDLLYSVKNLVAAELKNTNRAQTLIFSANFRRWLQYRLMPYGVGTIASLIVTFSLLMTLLSTKEAAREGVEKAQANSNRSVLIAANRNPKIPNDLYGGEYSLSDLPIADEMPTINPAGALVALTKSIVRGKMKDEEVVVVADVFGSGIARIAEVVEAPSDGGRAMQNLEKALNKNNSSAPFVPAGQDNRAEVVRVIFKIQRVDVIDKSSKAKQKYH